MVVAFAAFVGGYTKEILGPDMIFLAGAAATLVTWFTFLPSFIFHLSSLFFGYHVLWPQGFTGVFDWVAALIALLAAITLFYFKRSVIEVIAACAVIRLILKTFL